MKDPNFFKSDSSGLLQKWVPLSLKKALGVPNLVKIFLRRNFMTTLESLVGMAMASIHLET